jgi:choline transporter-like protein 2/4/5
MKNRRCTDFLFTILFLAFAGACGWVAIQGFNNGDPQKLLSGVDYDGKLCGVDHPNHPFLYFLVRLDAISTDATINLKAVCISECPEKNTTEPIDCALITEITAESC